MLCVIRLVIAGRTTPVPHAMNAGDDQQIANPECPGESDKGNADKSSPLRTSFRSPNTLRETADQPALQNHAEYTDVGINVSDLLRPERMPVPGEPALSEQRKSGHEQRKAKDEGKELPQQRRESRATKVLGIGTPREYAEAALAGSFQ